MPVATRARDVQELLSQLRIRFIVAPPEGGSRGGLGLPNATHLGTEVSRLEIDRNAVGLQDARQRFGDFAAEPFLNGKAASKEAHQPRELRNTDDVFVRDVAQVGVAEKGERVMLAERVERTRAVDHLAELTVWPAVAFGRKCGHQLGVPFVALRRIEHRSQVPLGRLERPWCIAQQAHGTKDLADVTLEAAPVLVADAPGTDALPIATLVLLVAQAANVGF